MSSPTQVIGRMSSPTRRLRLDESESEWTNIPGGQVPPQTPPQLTGFWIDGVAVLQTPPELRPVEQIVLPADAIEMKAYERDLPSLCDWEKRLSCNCAVLQLNRFASFC